VELTSSVALISAGGGEAGLLVEGAAGVGAKGFSEEEVLGAKGFEGGAEGAGAKGFDGAKGLEEAGAEEGAPPKTNPPKSTATAFGWFSFFSSSILAFSSGDSFHSLFALNARILPSFLRHPVLGQAKT